MEISQQEYNEKVYEFYKAAIIEFAKQNEIDSKTIFYSGVDAAKLAVDCYLEKMGITVIITTDNNSDSEIRKIVKEEIKEYEKAILDQLGRGAYTQK